VANVPAHLRKYCVQQNETRYSFIDHAAWRFIMRQLTSYLSVNAHSSYLDGLKKTGISTEKIPSIAEIDKHLQDFGWSAIPVSGFIPPAAFMELQSLGILPIASDMRTVDHMDYTPAPDIVHEAAGHAPILIHPEFSTYLHRYAQVAAKAILNKEDLDIYEAIRNLSDLKESPASSEGEIQTAENRLAEVSRITNAPSEGALLARMNWWTAEYGLIGDLEKPKLYGAGLLSSVGESRSALTDKVKKIPFSLKCIEYSYDITEPQPQLFVTPDFQTLTTVLDEFAKTMAYQRGGVDSLEKIKSARTVNTVELNSGIQISGVLANFLTSGDGFYLQFQGPSQLSLGGTQLAGHSRLDHKEGFGTPIGNLKGQTRCLSECTQDELPRLGLVHGKRSKLEFESGVIVDGILKGAMIKNNRIILLKFEDCTVTLGRQILFKPDWGIYDMAVGSKIPSVFGGPADRFAYGEVTDFVAKRVPQHELNPDEQWLNSLFKKVKEIRERHDRSSSVMTELKQILDDVQEKYPNQWLLQMEILELSYEAKTVPVWQGILLSHLQRHIQAKPHLKDSIQNGMKLAAARYH
jgi:phenylalanine-4-hydroxylase